MVALHQRKVIRDAVRDALMGKTAAGRNVETTRTDPWRRKNQLPAISVYTRTEQVDEASRDTAPRELTRYAEVTIAGAVSFSDQVDDDMDALALEIETAMHADPYLGGAAGDSILDNTEAEPRADGERLIGLLIMKYKVTYRTLAPDVSAAPPDDFLTADTRIRRDGVTDPSLDAHDTVTVRGALP